MIKEMDAIESRRRVTTIAHDLSKLLMQDTQQRSGNRVFSFITELDRKIYVSIRQQL